MPTQEYRLRFSSSLCNPPWKDLSVYAKTAKGFMKCADAHPQHLDKCIETVESTSLTLTIKQIDLTKSIHFLEFFLAKFG